MGTPQHGHRGRRLAAAVAAVLTAAAVALGAVAIAAQQHAPAPPASAANPAREVTLAPPASAPRPTSTARTRAGHQRTKAVTVGPVLTRSVPVRLDVSSIGVRGARLVRLGLASDGSIAVPPVGAGSPAGWYTGSPTPGQLGPAVLLGHVDSAAAGPGIFFRLGDLRPGDTAVVTRADHSVAVFTVDSLEKYGKAAFPTLRVFGNTDHAALRLITCGGTFDPGKHSYEDNIVVYAHLRSSRE